MNKQARLSIIIATYNSAETLQSCLDSIFGQTYPQIEIVIADGASTDGTVAVIEANSQNLGAWKSEPDTGIYDAWNKALDMATGNWLYFIGADDTLHAPDSIERAMDKLTRLPPGTLVAYGKTRYVRNNGEVIPLGQPWEIARKHIHSRMALPHQGVFHAREMFDRVGKFDSQLQISGDYKMIMMSLSASDPVFLGELFIANQNEGGKSTLRRNRIAALIEDRKVQADLGYPISVYWIYAFSKGLIWLILTRAMDFFRFLRKGLFKKNLYG